MYLDEIHFQSRHKYAIAYSQYGYWHRQGQGINSYGIDLVWPEYKSLSTRWINILVHASIYASINSLRPSDAYMRR